MSATPPARKTSVASARLSIGNEELEAFLVVAELQSFSKAAERLFLAQPSVSNRVQRLEHALSVRLFERTTRAVVLTPAGQRLRHRAEPIIRSLRDIIEEFRSESEGRRHVVSVATTPTLAAVLLPPIIQRFNKANANIHIELYDELTPHLASDFRSKRLDFAVMARGATSLAGVTFEPIMVSKFVVVGPRGHPALSSGIVTCRLLTQQPFLLLSAYNNELGKLTAALGEDGASLSAVNSVSRLSTLLGFVSSGLGLTLLPDLALTMGGIIDLARFDIASVEGVVLTREYGIASLPEHQWSLSAQAFAAAVRAHLAAMMPTRCDAPYPRKKASRPGRKARRG